MFLTGVRDLLSYNFFAVKYNRYFINENSLFSVQNIEITIKTSVSVISDFRNRKNRKNFQQYNTCQSKLFEISHNNCTLSQDVQIFPIQLLL